MIIDSHAHVIFPVEKQIFMMEEASIDKTILFSTTPHPEKACDMESFEKEMEVLTNILASNTTKEERINNIKRTTEELKEVIDRHPSKFIGFGQVPLKLTYDKTEEWILKNVIENKFHGLGEFSPASGNVKDLEVIFQASSQLGKLPIWVHTFYPLNGDDIKELLELSKKYSEVPLILGHMGGTNWLQTIKMAKESKNIYIDLSATFTILAPTIAIKELPDRSLFSSDAPYGDPLLLRTMVEKISPNKEVVDKVLGGNISRLLKL